MKKLVLAIIAIFLILVVSTVSIYQTISYTKNTHISREYSFLEILSEHIYYTEQQLQPYLNKVDTLKSIILKDSNITLSSKSINQRLVQIAGSEFISRAYILDSTGNCDFSSDTTILKQSFGNKIFYKKLENMKSHVHFGKCLKKQNKTLFIMENINRNYPSSHRFVMELSPSVFTKETKWNSILPKEIKKEIKNGIISKDLILLANDDKRLYHMSSLNEHLKSIIQEKECYSTDDIVNLKLLKKEDDFNFLVQHRILHRSNIYNEPFIIFSNPILNGELLQVSIIPHETFEKYYDTRDKFSQNFFKLLSAPIILIILLISALFVTIISYKKTIQNLINTSNLKAAEAAVAGIEKDEFLATVTHELRTPLNGIMGITTILKDSTPTDKQIEYLDMIDACSTSLLKTINDVLDISKIRSGVLSLTNKTFNLPVLIHEIITPIEIDAHKKKLSFFVNQSANIPDWLKGDAERIKQILECFLINAVKFTDMGSIKFEIELVNKTETDCTIKFEVSDTGIGISQDDQERMFETFTQAEMSTTRVYGGMGLGLSIAKSLSDLMKGDIILKSILGKGSTFSITLVLPLADTEIKNKERT